MLDNPPLLRPKSLQKVRAGGLQVSQSSDTSEQTLIRLAYELLDAHDDTARIGGALAGGSPEWSIHLDYLRTLQRRGRELIATVAGDNGAD